MNLAASRKVNSRIQASSSDFKADPAESIQSGMNVEHQQFGSGRVIKIEGEGDNRKAIVFFSKFGEKKLLLRFARLKIVR